MHGNSYQLLGAAMDLEVLVDSLITGASCKAMAQHTMYFVVE